MSKFDLIAAKAGKPIQTRSGKPAKFIAYLPDAPIDCRVICQIEGRPYFFYEDGGICLSSANEFDLVMLPTQYTMWVNFYMEENKFLTFATEEMANTHAEGFPDKRFQNKAFKLEWSE